MDDRPDGELTLFDALPDSEPEPAPTETEPAEPAPAEPAESPASESPSLDSPPAEPEPAASGPAESPASESPSLDSPTAGEPEVKEPEAEESAGEAAAGPEWPALAGSEAALAQLEAALAAPVHAYLLLGAPGSDKPGVARVFAAELLAAAAAPEGRTAASEHRRRALRGVHPDVAWVEPEGRALLTAEATVVITEAARRPVECPRKVIVCDRFHTASPGVAAGLLKTIEEPPPATVIVLLADHVPPGHVTIASRCVTVRLATPSAQDLEELLAASGASPELARRAARAAAGDPARAGELLADGGLADRFEAWWSLPDHLDGTGARTAGLVDELRGLIDAAEEAVATGDAAGSDAATSDAASDAADDPADRAEAQRRRRQTRRLRDSELRFGFAVLAGRYREALHPTDGSRADIPVARAGEAIDRLRAAGGALVRNPNEKLLLHDLLLHLPTAHR